MQKVSIQIGAFPPVGRVGLAFFMAASDPKKLNHRKRCFRLSVLIPKPKKGTQTMDDYFPVVSAWLHFMVSALLFVKGI